MLQPSPRKSRHYWSKITSFGFNLPQCAKLKLTVLVSLNMSVYSLHTLIDGHYTLIRRKYLLKNTWLILSVMKPAQTSLIQRRFCLSLKVLPGTKDVVLTNRLAERFSQCYETSENSFWCKLDWRYLISFSHPIFNSLMTLWLMTVWRVMFLYSFETRP